MSKPLGKPDRIVVALGGNALGNTPEEQIERVNNAAHALLGLIEQGNEIIITHGNGPQVGMIQNAFAAAHDAIGTPAMDLPECGAMSQGYIGYHLQQGIGREMHKRYKRWHVATVVTQIEVDPEDASFQNPTKPIGPFYTEEQAKEIMAEDPKKVFVDDSGRGWRRVVASPEPKKIVEAPSILNLLDNEFIVIACGGGGIPVVRDYENKGCYKGVAAVIDKDAGGERHGGADSGDEGDRLLRGARHAPFPDEHGDFGFVVGEFAAAGQRNDRFGNRMQRGGRFGEDHRLFRSFVAEFGDMFDVVSADAEDALRGVAALVDDPVHRVKILSGFWGRYGIFAARRINVSRESGDCKRRFRAISSI